MRRSVLCALFLLVSAGGLQGYFLFPEPASEECFGEVIVGEEEGEPSECASCQQGCCPTCDPYAHRDMCFETFWTQDNDEEASWPSKRRTFFERDR